MACSVPGCGNTKVIARGFCRRHYQRWWKGVALVSPTVEERFWAKVDRRGDDECWLWTAGVSKQTGYARFSDENGKTVSAHRWAYKRFVGPVSDEMDLDHECHNLARDTCLIPGECLHRRCVNFLNHLEPATRRTNMLRGNTIWRALSEVTHCPAEHEYTPENTYVNSRGHRSCRRCKAIQTAARRAAARAKR